MRVSNIPSVLLGLTLSALFCSAENFTKEQSVNFFRDVSSRDLSGLAVRSDGRLMGGPTLSPIDLDLAIDIGWGLAPLGADSWLVWSGPDGKILKVTRTADGLNYVKSLWADLDSDQVFSLLVLPDGRVVAGTSPSGTVVLLSSAGEKIAAVDLAADSVFDFLPWDAGASVLAATGNPGRIMRIDLAVMEKTEPAPRDETTAGADESSPTLTLAERGVSEFGSIQDRNVRSLALGGGNTVFAGSAPSGNLYRFAASGGSPLILLDHDKAEVTDIHVGSNGDVYAAIVYSATPKKTRVVTATTGNSSTSTEGKTPPAPPATIMEVAPTTSFTGRSALVMLPGGDGLPETLLSRSGIAVYRIEPHGDLLILPGGDNGELIGYDVSARRTLTFAGSDSAQITDISPLTENGEFLLLTNNPVGLHTLSFQPKGPRQVETSRINLRGLSDIGALRFNRIRNLDPSNLRLSLKTNRGSNEVEGWSEWSRLDYQNGGWKLSGLRGQYVKLRIEIPEDESSELQIDNGTLFHLPLNRRPSLQSFQVITPNYGLDLRPDSKTTPPPTLAQVLGDKSASRSQSDSERSKATLLSSQVVPMPGAQLITWSVTDADGDNFSASFSVRAQDSEKWIELASGSSQSWVQFDRSALPDGIYFTKLEVTETAPRPESQRHAIIFETDDLIVDQTAPVITDVNVHRGPKQTTVEVEGYDGMSLLLGVEISVNNGRYFESDQTADGILDEQSERFMVTLPASALEDATGIQVILQDTAGNQSAQRIELP